MTPQVVRPNLPPLVDGCSKVNLPPVTKGESVKVFALKNRRAAHEANGRIDQCARFYEDVQHDFGATR